MNVLAKNEFTRINHQPDHDICFPRVWAVGPEIVGDGLRDLCHLRLMLKEHVERLDKGQVLEDLGKKKPASGMRCFGSGPRSG